MARSRSLLVAVAVVSTFAARANAQGEPPASPEDGSANWGSEPARAADPPILPSPRPLSPLSTSGTDLVPVTTPAAPAIVGPDADKETVSERDTRMRFLEARLASDEQKLRHLDERMRILKNVSLGAFVQPQFLALSNNAAASPNLVNGSLPAGITSNDVVAKTDGTTTNNVLFRMRRTRFRIAYDADPVRLYFQIDPLPAGPRGSSPNVTILRNAEATGTAHWSRRVATAFTAGLFLVPFGAELQESPSIRPFIEYTSFAQNAFPGERDLGVVSRTSAFDGRMFFWLALINGQTVNSPNFRTLADLNKGKDGVARFGYRFGDLASGLSGYLGRGQIVDATALRFKQFSKWAVDYEASFRHVFLRRIGETRLSAELAIARNMDTGLNYAFALPKIPQSFGDDVTNVDGRAFYARFEQELTRWFLVGYRFDTYTPNTDVDRNARDTHAFVTVVRFTNNLRFMNEFDYAIDNAHADQSQAPSRHQIAFSSVFQAGF